MNDERDYALGIANIYKIKFKVVSVNPEKHPEYGNFFDVYTIRISRDKKSFTVKYGLGDLNFDDDIFTENDLPYAVLARIPKYDLGTFDEYVKSVGAKTVGEILTAKKWYTTDCRTYKQVNRLFSDIFEELREIA